MGITSSSSYLIKIKKKNKMIIDVCLRLNTWSFMPNLHYCLYVFLNKIMSKWSCGLCRVRDCFSHPPFRNRREVEGLILLNPPIIDACCPFLHPLDHLLVCDAEFLPRIQQGDHNTVLGVSVNHSPSSWKQIETNPLWSTNNNARRKILFCSTAL